VIVAICGVLATIIVPCGLFLAARYLDRRSLQVSLNVHEAPFPSVLRVLLKNQANAQFPSFGPPTATSQFASKDQLELASRIRTHLKLTIDNPTKKKHTGITVTITTAPLWGLLYQSEEEIELSGPNQKKIVLGDLQPHQSRTLHFWTTLEYIDAYYPRISEIFDVTADELDKRPTRFPIPSYLKTYISRQVSWYFMWTVVTFLVFEFAFLFGVFSSSH
jgi:hypothetical protein